MAESDSQLLYFTPYYGGSAHGDYSGFAWKPNSADASRHESLIALDPYAFPSTLNVDAQLFWPSHTRVYSALDPVKSFAVSAGSVSFSFAAYLNGAVLDGDHFNVPVANFIYPSSGQAKYFRGGRCMGGNFTPLLADVGYVSASADSGNVQTWADRTLVASGGTTRYLLTEQRLYFTGQVNRAFFSWRMANAAPPTSMLSLKRVWCVCITLAAHLTFHQATQVLSNGEWVTSDERDLSTGWSSAFEYTRLLTDPDPCNLNPVGEYVYGQQFWVTDPDLNLWTPSSGIVEVASIE